MVGRGRLFLLHKLGMKWLVSLLETPWKSETLGLYHSQVKQMKDNTCFLSIFAGCDADDMYTVRLGQTSYHLINFQQAYVCYQ